MQQRVSALVCKTEQDHTDLETRLRRATNLMQRWDLASVVCARQRQFGALRGEALAERNLRAMRGVFEFALPASESVPAERMPNSSG